MSKEYWCQMQTCIMSFNPFKTNHNFFNTSILSSSSFFFVHSAYFLWRGLSLGNTCSVIAWRHWIWLSVVSSFCSAALSLKMQRALPLSKEHVTLKCAGPSLSSPLPWMTRLSLSMNFSHYSAIPHEKGWIYSLYDSLFLLAGLYLTSW